MTFELEAENGARLFFAHARAIHQADGQDGSAAALID
jgi:hypothetical protein